MRRTHTQRDSVTDAELSDGEGNYAQKTNCVNSEIKHVQYSSDLATTGICEYLQIQPTRQDLQQITGCQTFNH